MQKKSWWTRRRILAVFCALVLVAGAVIALRARPARDDPPPGKLPEGQVSSARPDSSGGSSFVTERISNNYTAASAAYTMPKYAGEAKRFPAADCLREGSGVETVTPEAADGIPDAQVLRVRYGDTFTLAVEAPEDGLYAVRFDYYSYDPEAGEDLQAVLPDQLGMMVDGAYPFYECRNVRLEATWLRATEPTYDRYGDEMVALPRKEARWETKYLTDGTYRRTRPLLLELGKGEHLLTFTVGEGTFLFGGVTLCAEPEIPAYAGSPAAEGDALITLQGEAFTSANDSSVHAVMEYDVAVDPYEVDHARMNTIDSDAFDTAGQAVTWHFDVEKDGWYNLALNYRQSDKTDFPVFVDVAVDGEIPSLAFEAYPLAYSASWQTRTLKDTDGGRLSVWLPAGRHSLTLRLTITPIREVMEALDEIMYGVNDLALEITKVAGTNADKYRDLRLSDYIPDVSVRLRGYAAWLRELEGRYLVYSASERSVPAMASMLIAAAQLESLAEHPDQIPYRIAELSSSSNSANQYLANTIDRLLDNSLAVDRIWICQEGAELPRAPGAGTAVSKSVSRFASSFTSQRYSTANTDPTHLQVWVNRSNQYVQIMQKMIDESFTPATGIKVDISIMPDQTKLVLANSSGNSPDVATGINYTIPYELAIRGALADMTQFEDFREVASVYEPGFFLTGCIDEGIYSMPETMNFWVLFYRTDVMEKLGIPVPDTMTDVIDLLPELQMRGLNFYYPTAGMLSMRNFHGTTPLIVQNGGSLYYGTAQEGTALGSRESVTGFTALTDLFTIYNMPVNVDNFYQHFRNGDYPIGIADFYSYNLIRNAAPELDGSWAIALIPGTVRPDGSMSRATCGCADATVIFRSDAEREAKAWQFVRWWSSTEVQARFGRQVQSIYGDEYMWPTANMQAFALLPWDSEDKEVVRTFAAGVVDVARVPGTYMLEREMSNAFNDITVNGAGEQARIDKAVKTINREIRRKLEEFGYIDAQGNTIREYRIPTIERVRVILGRDGAGQNGGEDE
ncbi:MAG: extracellular solute-binding protein [Clostridia bacterium]|nr:extracellular solute-binding protein [Clostridia bacterium]